MNPLKEKEKEKMKKFMIALVALMMLVSGAVAETEMPDVPFHIVEEDGKTLIEVNGNATTGYVWSLFQIVEGVVNTGDFLPVEVETDEALLGAGKLYRVEVEAVAEGETILVLRYIRPWELAVEQEVAILVNVDENNDLHFMHLEGMPMEMTAIEKVEGENAYLLESETLGQLIATFPEDMALPVEGEMMKVWFDGVVAMSLPGRINVMGWETIAPIQARMMPGPVVE